MVGGGGGGGEEEEVGGSKSVPSEFPPPPVSKPTLVWLRSLSYLFICRVGTIYSWKYIRILGVY